MIRAAFIYDFDGTLAKGNIQENSFIPSIGMTKDNFWKEVKKISREENADEILVYMNLMLERAREHEPEIKVTKSALADHGADVKLFPGLASGGWFRRMNQFAESLNIELSHYIISSGIEEMIEGCSIRPWFRNVFGSSFLYSGDTAKWPATCINYTTKTQYLFRINKGIENHWESDALNSYTPRSKRAIRFQNMVFFGDGSTDIPAMKMLTYQGGTSIAVYEDTISGMQKVHSLVADGRCEYTAPADYSEFTPMDVTAKGILGRMARKLQDESA